MNGNENHGFEHSAAERMSPPQTQKEKGYGQVEKKPISLLKIFLLCLLASVITTAVGVLILALVYVTEYRPQSSSQPQIEIESPTDSRVDIKYSFLNHLDKSKVFELPGGAIQWARYRKDTSAYEDEISMQFGRSINERRSKMTIGTLRIKSNGLRLPHWHFNANEHGYLQQGKAWIGVVDDGTNIVATYNITAGQLFFFPKNTLHWVKNVGDEDCVFVLFFTTHEQLLTLDIDDTFFSTPEDIASRSLKPEGGVKFIRSFSKQKEDQGINLPANLKDLVTNASYVQSPDAIVWKYFYDLPGSTQFVYPGGIIQWARYRSSPTNLTENEKIYGESVHEHADTLTMGTLRIYSNGLRQPHFHFNANEMGYVVSGCGQVGIIGTSVTDFQINVGDVFFFPIGTQHYIQSSCTEDLLLILGFTTGDQLETLDMDDYFNAAADHILAQAFHKPQNEFQKIPVFKDDQAVNIP
ncbi:uncharacterized LOC103185496 [Callorhinchus milii]|uniref:Uncharacterized LOC103185496 n=1 Tax=Callorhinchus milii TaxID=7868 RepID=A0A4W3I9E5_CALMI|nr:uncharacterized LOC103185496 [Callorhinchus milii]|eukprot:gi/632971541/ref/XP_007902221.1/ PREDICTED: uncharacterized protein LOC103185496 [Callorhinchus milii]